MIWSAQCTNGFGEQQPTYTIRERERERKKTVGRNIEWLQKMCNIVKRLSQVSVFVVGCGMYILWIISKFIAFQHVFLLLFHDMALRKCTHIHTKNKGQCKKHTTTSERSAYVTIERGTFEWSDAWIMLYFRSSFNARYFYSHWTHFINHNRTNRTVMHFMRGQFARTFDRIGPLGLLDLRWLEHSNIYTPQPNCMREWLKWLALHLIDWWILTHTKISTTKQKFQSETSSRNVKHSINI